MKNKNKKTTFFKGDVIKKNKDILSTFLAATLIVSLTSTILSFVDRNIAKNNLDKDDLKKQFDDDSNSDAAYLQLNSIIKEVFAINDVNAAPSLSSNYKSQLTKVSDSIKKDKGSKFTYQVTFKNIGNYVWRKDGNSQILLIAKDVKNSYLADKTWVSGNVVSKLPITTVSNGKSITFNIPISLPDQEKIFTQKFALNFKSLGFDIVGSEFTLTVDTTKSGTTSSDKKADVVASNLDQDSNGDVKIDSVSYISNTKDFQILDAKNNMVVLNVKADQKVSVFYNKSIESYLVVSNGMILVSTKNKLNLINSNKGTFSVGDKKTENSLLSLKSDFDSKNNTKVESNGKVVCASLDCGVTDTISNPINTNQTQDSQKPDTTTPVVQVPVTVITDNKQIKNYSHPVIKNAYNLRVGLDYNLLPATVTNTKSYNLVDSNNSILATFNANEQVSLNYDKVTKLYSYSKNNVQFNTSSYVKLVPTDNSGVFTVLNMSKIPYWNDSINFNMFRGNIEVRYNSIFDRSWIINEVSIEDYLKGSGESSNSNAYEYLKSMAVSQRTYASYHYLTTSKNGKEYFDVMSTTADQVYDGYIREIRQPNVVKAVNETTGVFITYNNQVIQALYSANAGGQTRTAKQAWGGADLPYLKSVADKYTASDTRYGHGVGLSQVGAMRMISNDNAKMEDILTYYYSNVNLYKFY